MQRRDFVAALGGATMWTAFSTRIPAAGAQGSSCYKPGDIVDPDSFVLDAQQSTVKLKGIMRQDAKAIVLTIFGGAYSSSTEKHGGIWCEDSLDEFANLKAAQGKYAERGVQFIGVACPPVYSDKYGYEANVFLDLPENAPKYKTTARDFIDKTEALRKDHTIPFSSVYYDLRFRLLWNPTEHKATEAYGKVFPWQGRFKWDSDVQRYGTPCIWFLSPNGKVLREPLYGNNYSGTPPKILFTFWELEGAITESLK